jgi:hypothetical protein
VASNAAAQSIAQPRSWTLTPFLHTSAGVGDPAPENSGGFGVAVGYDLTSNLGFEGEISHLFDVAGDTDDVDWLITKFQCERGVSPRREARDPVRHVRDRHGA